MDKIVRPRESPKNTVRIAPVDKNRDSKGPEIASIFSQASASAQKTEFASFKEEMREMLKDMNKTATKTVTDKITEKIDTLDRKFSNMFTDIKEDIKSVRAEVLEAKEMLKK